MLDLPPKAPQPAVVHPSYHIEKLHRLSYLEIRQLLSITVIVLPRAELCSISVGKFDTRIFVLDHVVGAAYAWCNT